MDLHTAPVRGTLEGALAMIQSGDTIATPIYGNEPSAFLRQLHTIAPRVQGVVLWTMLTMDNYPVMCDNTLQGSIDIYTFFYNNNCRDGHETGRFQLSPLNLHSVGQCVVATRRPNVFVACVSPPDAHGMVYLSFDMQGSLECMAAADTVIFEINKQIPRIFGETAVPFNTADYCYEVDRPLPIAPIATATETDRKIAQNVLELIHDGDCIQLGIGGLLNAVGEALLERRDLGLHTEMLTTAMGKLIRAGVITGARKNFNPGKIIGTFAWGDQALYETLAENTSVQLRRACWVNDPAVIAQNDNMVSVNTALQVDLTGQICSETLGSRQYSGTGGAADFAYGAVHSKGGRGIIAIPSTTKNGTVSKILPQLTPGAVVSITRNISDYVVTEYGVAKLRNRTIRQRVDALIGVAHPDFRAELRREADRLMLW
jgi:acyl-CoA hydrolase